MTKQFGTLSLIGFMAAGLVSAAGCIDTGHDRGYAGGGGGAACPDYQYFTVLWGIDHGVGTLPLTCAQIGTMASHVELTTNLVAPDPNATLIPSFDLSCQDGATCPDGSPCNMSANTASGLAVGTYVTAATLVGTDGSQLAMPIAGQGQQYGITQCDGSVLPFIFTLPSS